MTTATFQPDISVDTLVRSAQQLSESDFERLTSAVLEIRAKRASLSVSKEEGELLLECQLRLPDRRQARYDELLAKRDNEKLTPLEYEELLELTRESESLDVRRVRALTDLAHLRRLTLDQLMRQMQCESLSAGE